MNPPCNGRHKKATVTKWITAVAKVVGLMLLVAFSLIACFWLALLLASRKDTVNQCKNLCALSRGKLRDMRHQLLAQIGAGRVAVAVWACII